MFFDALCLQGSLDETVMAGFDDQAEGQCCQISVYQRCLTIELLQKVIGFYFQVESVLLLVLQKQLSSEGKIDISWN